MAHSFLSKHLIELFEQAPGFMAVLRSPAHVFEMANLAYGQLVGHRDLLGKDVRQAFPELEGQGFFELLDQVYATGVPFVGRGLKVEFSRGPGEARSTRYVNFVYQPIVGEGGEIVGIFAEGSDVTELFEAKEALAENVARLEALDWIRTLHLELADALGALSVEKDMGEAAALLLERNWSCRRVVLAVVDDGGERYEARAFGADAFPEPEHGDLAELGAAALAALRSGRWVDVQSDPGAFGGLAWKRLLGDRAAASLIVPIAKGGRLGGLVALIRAQELAWPAGEADAASGLAERLWSALESLRARTRLRAERDQSAQIFDNMAEGFSIFGSDWRALRVNPTGLRLGQRESGEVLGRALWEVWPEVVGTEVEVRYRRAMETREPDCFEEEVVFPSGESVWLEMRLQPLADGGLAAFYRDVGERREFVRRLVEGDRRKDEFLAMLAHELRNPLAPISAAAQMLEMVAEEPARVRQIGKVIGRQSKHMASLIGDLLDVSRVTTGLVAIESERVDLNKVAEESIEQVMPFVEAKGHRFSFAPAPSAVAIGDRKRLVQVATNLLQNAAKFTPDGGSIEMGLRRVGAEIELCVRDSGAGIDHKLLPLVFDLFTQGHRSSDRSQGGLGLGLALVRSLVSLHGGKVWAESGGLGLGSTFTVRLPAAEEGRLPAEGSALAAPKRPLRLLVVDDNVDAADLLAMFLETSGHDVEVQYTSSAALETARDHEYDAFVLDIGLPEMDGNELARRLRAMSTSSKATLIAVTGYGQQYDRDASIAAGFDYYFVKPANPKVLVELLSGLDAAPKSER